MTCSNCGSVQAETNAFCESCGAALSRNTCRSCNQPLPADDRFCQGCGTPVAAAQDKSPWGAPTTGGTAPSTPPPPPPPQPGPWQAAPGASYPPPATGFAPPASGYPAAGYAGAVMPPGAPPGQYFPQGPAGHGPGVGAPLAEWGTRAGGWLLDAAIIGVPYLVIGLGLGQVSVFFTIIGWLYAAGFGIWFAVQVGQSGQSPGMRVAGVRCVSMKTGRPVGGGLGFVRSLCHGLMSALCFIPFVVDMLFPLWDGQKQTLGDKMMSTVVITVPKQPFSLTP